jgi:hypothetical protein
MTTSWSALRQKLDAELLGHPDGDKIKADTKAALSDQLARELDRRIEERRGDPEFLARLNSICEEDAEVLDGLSDDIRGLRQFEREARRSIGVYAARVAGERDIAVNALAEDFERQLCRVEVRESEAEAREDARERSGWTPLGDAA